MIYFDNNSTTPVDAEVLEAMMPYLTHHYGNPSSTHSFGQSTNDAIKQATNNISQLIGCEKNEIVFTSGATESINLAMKGLAEKYGLERNHIITLKTEHKAVLDVSHYLEKRGFKVSYLPVNSDGLLDLEELKNELNPKTLLVNVMLANNETGIIQPIQGIAQLSHDAGAFFMTDATQAFGKIPIDVDELNIDLMAFSGHKIYGPKGIGGLYVRSRGSKKVKLDAHIHGGGHQRGFRSGTLNAPGIIGLGEAARIAKEKMSNDANHTALLRDHLESQLLMIEGLKINGNTESRLPNTTNLYFEGIDSDALMMGLEDIMISNGSACTSTSTEPSHVLKAMGLDDDEAYCCLRFGFSRFNTIEEVEIVVEKIKEVTAQLRQMNIA